MAAEATALVALVLALWTAPAMVSEAQDRTPATLAARHVDSALLGEDARARALLGEADALAMQLVEREPPVSR
ncbi:MAG: hypothetical protein ACMVO5_05570 [Polymorphobacter sp.]|uniref:hypothetical protein n=1 Tax=Polymorphobacter sp. TaxID=1909290 RepID=UPI003A89F6AD